jgi:hypothetical protein
MRTQVRRSEAMILVGYFFARCVGQGTTTLCLRATWGVTIGKYTRCSTIALRKGESLVPFETAFRTCGTLSTLMSITGEGARIKDGKPAPLPWLHLKIFDRWRLRDDRELWRAVQAYVIG